MRRSSTHLPALGLLLLAFVLLMVVGKARAQDIANTARVTYIVSGETKVRASNTVTTARVSNPVRLSTFHPTLGSGSSFSAVKSQCSAGIRSAAANAAGSTPNKVTYNLEQTNQIRVGETLVFSFSSPAANRDAAAIDTLTARLVTGSDDTELLAIYESDVNSGIFVGEISTTAVPPLPVARDCVLSVAGGSTVTIEILAGPDRSSVISVVEVNVLADPFGYVFDSETGEPVDGARVTLIDVATGQPAKVFAPDGITAWPSSIVTGQPFRDGAGNLQTLPAGEYRFPLAALGSYRLQIEAPSPYAAPSNSTQEQLATVARPDGTPLKLGAASWGASFSLGSVEPVEIDVPLDRPSIAVSLTKTASRASAAPGDAVIYAIEARNIDTGRVKRDVVLTDRPSQWLRLRPDSVRVDGKLAPGAVSVAADGRTLTVRIGTLAPAASRKVTYAMTVRPDAPAGTAENRVDAIDARGNRSSAGAAIRIEEEGIAGRMTLIGRVSYGDCSVSQNRPGVAGVRVVLEDGSFAVTDADGRYHFEGLVPFTHVVQAQDQTLPEGSRFVDCARSSRSAGKANSRFVTGQGGTLAVADFAVIPPVQGVGGPAARPDAKDDEGDAALAAGDRDWIGQGDGKDGFLFPDIAHNPRAPAVRAVVRHRKGQTVELLANGKPVEKVALEGTTVSPDRRFAVSVWRGIPLPDGDVRLEAVIRNVDGSVASKDERFVHFSNQAVRVEIDAARSRLVADGRTRPVLALRVLDRSGRPVHDGVSGELSINAPYESAEALARMQANQLSGGAVATPTWRVKGDDGIALVELAPTMVSGSLRTTFRFVDGEQKRQQQLESWIVPGDQKWTLVGLVEGTSGSRSVAEQMQAGAQFDSDLGDDARVAFYAKGRVLGRFLLTAAYDSAKQKNQQVLLGAIDPQAYYTVFADGSSRQFDAASREKLYVRVEAKAFYAIYGDIVTGFDQTQLARYQRTFTGIKAEGSQGRIHAQAFAAKVGSGLRRDEIQGNGLTGPYSLSSRAYIPASETVIIETRDRARSEIIVSSRTLTRYVDYDIDPLTATITFRQPVLSRDSNLNPQFIVVTYEIAGTSDDEITAGARADVTFANDKVRIGASVVSEKDATANAARKSLGGADLRFRPDAATEIRAEAALSRADGAGADASWLIEVERHDGKLDMLSYARSIGREFGLNQQNMAERGRRKVGFDGRYAVTRDLSVIARAWMDDELGGESHRRAAELNGTLKLDDTDLRAGITHYSDHLADGSDTASTVLEGNVTRRLLDDRFELSATGSIALGQTGSIDLPARQRIGAAYRIGNSARLLATYEIASGDALDARALRAGFELTPWRGARLTSAIGSQSIAEYGKRSFANFGIGQSVEVAKGLTIDATLDGERILGGVDAARIINPDQPVQTGGQIGAQGLVETFSAATVGAVLRRDLWSVALRGEIRDGEWADRRGITLGAVRQMGEGVVIGSGFSWTRAVAGGTSSTIFDGSLATAYRPENAELAGLARLSYRSDQVVGVVAGAASALGNSVFSVDGNALARRVLASVSLNWTPRDKVDLRDGDDRHEWLQRSEFELFLGARYNFDRLVGYDLSSVTLLGGFDARVGIGERFELGGRATVRASLSEGATSFAYGPSLGFVPTGDVLVTLGYNVSGFADRDLSEARFTRRGVFVSGKIKFDANSLDFLGLR